MLIDQTCIFLKWCVGYSRDHHSNFNKVWSCRKHLNTGMRHYAAWINAQSGTVLALLEGYMKGTMNNTFPNPYLSHKHGDFCVKKLLSFIFLSVIAVIKNNQQAHFSTLTFMRRFTLTISGWVWTQFFLLSSACTLLAWMLSCFMNETPEQNKLKYTSIIWTIMLTET